MLHTIRDHSQCECLGGSQGLRAGPPIDGNSGESWNVSDPPPVVLTGKLDLEVKRLSLSSVFHRFKLSVRLGLQELVSVHSLYVPADRAIRLLPEQGRKLHIVAHNLIELWTVATRPLGENGLGMTAAEAALELDRIESMFLFLPETPAIYPAWEALVIQHQVMGKPAHDARLVAAMQVHGLTAILTFDRTGFSGYPGVEVIHPEQVKA